MNVFFSISNVLKWVLLHYFLEKSRLESFNYI